MVERTTIIVNKTGIHARPASEFAKAASKFSSKITILKGDTQGNAKSIINLMSMGLFKDTEIIIRAEGEDENLAIETMLDFIANMKD